MSKPPSIQRKGVARNYTFDRDALELLPALTSNRKGYGRLISELIRSEVTRREERRRLKEAVLQVFEKPICP